MHPGGSLWHRRPHSVRSARSMRTGPRSASPARCSTIWWTSCVRAADRPCSIRALRVVEWLGRNPADLTPLEQLVKPDDLSVSHFLHLFSDEIGVPFRRFRIWNRLRAASGMALRGANLTDAAIGAGFSDSAHFSRLHRETFGVTPSYILGRLVRATIAARKEGQR